MAVQVPTRADALEIENADAVVGPRLIEARLSDGSLLFTDPQIPGGIALYELAGLQRAQNTIIVSQTGEAASKDPDDLPITTIQDALDQIPDSSDVNNPWLILLAPGVYDENVLWQKDHVTLKGLGSVTLRAPADLDTIQVVQGVSTVPRRLRIQNVRIENSFNGRACVNFSTSQFAIATVTLAANPNVGDSLTIAGSLLTAIANGGVPVANEFEIGIDENETVLNLITAIKDPLNGLTTVVVPTGLLNVLTIRAFLPGVAGNLLTLVSSVPIVMVPSGPLFTGGLDNSNGSTVALELAEILDCDLAPTGLNGYQVRAQAVNNIKVRGGDWTDSGAAITFVDIREVALFDMEDVIAQLLELHYDSAAVNKPSIVTSVYSIRNITSTGQLNSDLDGIGSLTSLYSKFANVSVAGTATFRFEYSNMVDVIIGDTAALLLSHCKRGTLAGVGTTTSEETRIMDSLVFANSLQETFTFDAPNPDINYQVVPEIVSTDTPFVPTANKTTTGFTIDFPVLVTDTIRFVVHREV